MSALAPIAAEQGGLVSAAQAVLAGVTRNQLSDLAAGGDLRHLRRGVYGVGPGDVDAELEDIASAWLAIAGGSLPWGRDGEPEAVVSHASAARLHWFGTTIADPPELTQARQRSRRTDMVIHPARLGADDWAWLQTRAGMHLPVTTPARTIVDLLDSVGVEGTALVVLAASNEMVARSAANLAWAKTILAHNLNLYDIFTHDHVVIAKDALELIEETFA